MITSVVYTISITLFVCVCLFVQEFIQLYQILLPRGLLSSQGDVKIFLLSMNLNMDNFQIGKNKVSRSVGQSASQPVS